MKKLLLASLVLFSGIITNAQTIGQYNHVPLPGEMFSNFNCDTVNIRPGATGAGSTWNYSALVTNSATVNNYTTTLNTNTSYPSAWVETASSVNNSSFYSFTSTNLFYHGGKLSYTLGGNTVNATFVFTSPAIYASYPMSIGTTTASSTAGTFSVSAFSGSFTGNCTILADATGTLTLPSKTFNRILRVVTTQTINGTTTFGNVTVVSKNYDYYETGSSSKAPLLTIASSTLDAPFGNHSEQTFVTVSNGYTFVGLNEKEVKDIALSVYPNPSTSVVNFSTVSLDAAKVVISDITGKIIATEQFEMGKSKLNTNSLTAGLYLYNVVDKNNQTIATGKFNVTR